MTFILGFLRVISSRKAPDIFQAKLKEGSKLYTWMSILYMIMFWALLGMSQGSAGGMKKYCVTGLLVQAMQNPGETTLI